MLGDVQQCLASRQNPTWGRKRSREAFSMRIDSREGVPVSVSQADVPWAERVGMTEGVE